MYTLVKYHVNQTKTMEVIAIFQKSRYRSLGSPTIKYLQNLAICDLFLKFLKLNYIPIQDMYILVKCHVNQTKTMEVIAIFQ